METPSASPTPAPTPSPTLEPLDAHIQGLTLNEASVSLASPDVQFVIDNYLRPSGANYVALIPTCLSETYNDTGIRCDVPGEPLVSTPTDQELVAAIQRLHAAGFRVILKPQALVLTELEEHRYAIRGEHWSEKQWLAWFDSYISFISRYARLSQENQVDLFVVGNEQQDTTHREQDWRRVIAAVRQEYAGPITYAANSWMFEAANIRFWDALDFIGTNWYFNSGTSRKASVEDMVAHWKPMVDQLEAMALRESRDVIITEVGPSSAAGNNSGALYWWSCSTYDGQEQADYLQALFDSLLEKSWLKGVVLWSLDTDPWQGGPGDIGTSFVGKPAEEVVRLAFAGTARLLPGTAMGMAWREDPGRSLIIYRGALQNGWRLYTEAGIPAPQLDAISPSDDTRAIRVSLATVPEVQLYFDDPYVPMTRYKWVEFDLLFDGILPPSIYLAFARFTPSAYTWSRALDVMKGGYFGESEVVPGRWYHLKIPLSDLGITDQVYAEFHIMGQGRGRCPIAADADLYINNIRLIAGVPPTDDEPSNADIK